MLDVVKNGTLEEDGLLLDEPDILAKPIEVQFVDRLAVEFDRAGLWIIPPFDQSNNRALAGTGLALGLINFVILEFYELGTYD